MADFKSNFKNKVSKEFCGGCSIFDDSKCQNNMIKNNICPKRVMVGCPKEDDSQS